MNNEKLVKILRKAHQQGLNLEAYGYAWIEEHRRSGKVVFHLLEHCEYSYAYATWGWRAKIEEYSSLDDLRSTARWAFEIKDTSNPFVIKS